MNRHFSNKFQPVKVQRLRSIQNQYSAECESENPVSWAKIWYPFSQSQSVEVYPSQTPIQIIKELIRYYISIRIFLRSYKNLSTTVQFLIRSYKNVLRNLTRFQLIWIGGQLRISSKYMTNNMMTSVRTRRSCCRTQSSTVPRRGSTPTPSTRCCSVGKTIATRAASKSLTSKLWYVNFNQVSLSNFLLLILPLLH